MRALPFHVPPWSCAADEALTAVPQRPSPRRRVYGEDLSACRSGSPESTGWRYSSESIPSMEEA